MQVASRLRVGAIGFMAPKAVPGQALARSIFQGCAQLRCLC